MVPRNDKFGRFAKYIVGADMIRPWADVGIGPYKQILVLLTCRGELIQSHVGEGYQPSRGRGTAPPLQEDGKIPLVFPLPLHYNKGNIFRKRRETP